MTYILLLLVTVVEPVSGNGVLRYGLNFSTEASCEAHLAALKPSIVAIAKSVLPEGTRFRDPHFVCREEKSGQPI